MTEPRNELFIRASAAVYLPTCTHLPPTQQPVNNERFSSERAWSAGFTSLDGLFTAAVSRPASLKALPKSIWVPLSLDQPGTLFYRTFQLLLTSQHVKCWWRPDNWRGPNLCETFCIAEFYQQPLTGCLFSLRFCTL